MYSTAVLNPNSDCYQQHKKNNDNDVSPLTFTRLRGRVIKTVHCYRLLCERHLIIINSIALGNYLRTARFNSFKKIERLKLLFFHKFVIIVDDISNVRLC